MVDEQVVVLPAQLVSAVFQTNAVLPVPTSLRYSLDEALYAIDRAEAEARHDVVQVVSAFALVFGPQVVVHRRTALGDRRLAGCESILFGGHLGPADRSPRFSWFDRINGPALLERELVEEISLPARPSLSFQGQGLGKVGHEVKMRVMGRALSRA